MQYLFLALFQAFIAVLALATLLLLVATLWQVFQGGAISALLSGAGAAVTGAAAGWLLARQKDARIAYKAVQRGLAKYGC